MVNKAIFSSPRGAGIPQADAVNAAGGRAYSLSNEQALAQYAATGCLSRTFYAGAEEQLEQVLALCDGVHPEFIARTALFARERAHMKDMPAVLCAVLAKADLALLARVFPRVIDNGRMLRNFVQVLRSGRIGRRSLGSSPRRLVRQWLEARTDEQLLTASIGSQPSLADVVRMVHPRPRDPARAAFYGWLLGRPHDAAALPAALRAYEELKAGRTAEVPDVPFQMLASLGIGPREWAEVARRASWQTTRMNLNTFVRQRAFEQPGVTELVAARLRDPDAVRRARVFPYQLLVAWQQAADGVPAAVREALQDAMEHALRNVPEVPGQVFVFPDVSGSMSAPVTGWRKGSTSKVRCIDVAALVAAAILRRNPRAEVLPFESDVVSLQLNPRDTVLTNAEKLARIGGGGTNCSAPLRALNARQARGDLVIYVSDSESWVDSGGARHGGTATLEAWRAFKGRNPRARLVCIDLAPNRTTQVREDADVLNVGGFSDQVFTLLTEFAHGRLGPDHWVGVIERIAL